MLKIDSMKKVSAIELLKEVETITEQVIQKTEQKILSVDKEILYKRPGENKWSAAECLEHLNFYADGYHPEFKKAIQKMIRKREIAVPEFKSTWLGNYFANSLKLTGEEVKIAMRAPAKSNPVKSLAIRENVVEEFLIYQKEMLEFIEQCKNINIGKVKLPTTLSKYIKVKLGDGLRIIVYHNQRHVVQAVRALSQ